MSLQMFLILAAPIDVGSFSMEVERRFAAMIEILGGDVYGGFGWLVVGATL